MPEERNRGPTSKLQVMCVVFSLANTNLNKLVCVYLKGRYVCCVHVGDKEHPGAWAGVSWSWNLYISQTSLAVNHLQRWSGRQSALWEERRCGKEMIWKAVLVCNVPKSWLCEGTSSSGRLHRCMHPEEGKQVEYWMCTGLIFFPRRSYIDLELCHFYQVSSYCISHPKSRHIPIHSKDFGKYIPIGSTKHTLGLYYF